MAKNLSLTFREMLPPIVADELDQLLVRLNNQLSSTDTGVQAELDALTTQLNSLVVQVAALDAGVELLVHKNAPGGYAGLNASAFVPIGIGGTNSGTALSGTTLMMSSGSAIIQTGFLTNAGGTDLVMPGISAPSTPAAGYMTLYAVTNNGHTTPNYIDQDGTVVRLARDRVVLVRNTSGSDMTKGQLVDVNGSTGQVPTIRLADADQLGPPPFHAEGMLLENIANNAFGQMVVAGLISGLDTSAFAEGTQLYVSTTAGAVTSTAPSSPNFIQEVGIVTNQHVTQGSILLNIPPRVSFGDPLSVAHGGTGLASYAIGDLLYASAATTLSRLADVATGNALISGGATTAPSWGKIGLTTHVSGVLPEANGGTNQSTYAQGDLLYASAANTLAKLVKDTNATRYLSNTGTSNAPVWAQVNIANGLTITSQATGDIVYASSATVWARLAIGSATTVLHGGTTPSYSAVSLTADVSGILPVANGGIGIGTLASNGVLYGNGTSAIQALAVNSTATNKILRQVSSGAPTWEAFVESLTGTANQVIVSASTGAVTLSLPQSIATSSTPEFARLGVGVGAAASCLLSVGVAGTAAYDAYFKSTNGRVGFSVATGTNPVFQDFTNTGGTAYYGIESSAGGAVLTGSLANALVFNTGSAHALQFGTTDTVRLTIAAGGSVGIGTAAPSALLSVAEKLLITSGGLISQYNNVATVAWGVPAIYGTGRATGQTGAVTTVATYTVGAADGSFDVSANVNVTSATLYNFQVLVDYTDEGSVTRTLPLQFTLIGTSFSSSITNAIGGGPYSAPALRIRCKASTAVKIYTSGTFTTVTYNVEGTIVQVA
jgi:hypothetical protein